MLKLRAKSLISVLAIFALFCSGCGQELQGTKFPEEVSDAVSDSTIALLVQGEISTRYEFEDARNRIAASLFSTMRTDSLSRADSLYYGRMLFWSGRDKKARNVFEDLVARGGKKSRLASLEIIDMEIENGDWSVAETMIADYRKLYPPGPINLWALYDQCENIGGRYIDKKRLGDAIRVYIEELNSLPFDARHRSFTLLSDLANACQEADKLEICRTELLRCREGFDKSFAVYADTVTYADSTEQAEDATYKWYEQYIRICNRLMERIDLIGKPAPDLTFMHVFNADSSLTLQSLRGKVVMLDFWTTWCGACIMGYEELRILHKEYKSRGLEIIGVTSLQGKYTNMETGEIEEDIVPEREIEITREYIKSKDLFWPCAIAEASIFDNGYTVSAVPTFVVIDREGRIRIIRTFVGEIEQKKRIIERYL